MSAHHDQKTGRCMLSNWLEERAVASIDTEETKTETHKYGHRRLLSTEQGAKMEDVTTVRATYVRPRDPGVRLRGRRIEHLEKQISQSIRERVELEMTPASCKPEYCSVSNKDFTIEGFMPLEGHVTTVHDYKSEVAVTFWSENYHQIQGVTPVRSACAPFRKCSQFSRPIGEQLYKLDPALEDCLED